MAEYPADFRRNRWPNFIGVRKVGVAALKSQVFKSNVNNLIIFLVIAGILRVLVFSAAFPVFNNVDETAHFDAVVKYSRGFLPNPNNLKFDREAAELIVRDGTLEYLSATPFTPPTATEASIQVDIAERVSLTNHEAVSPPLYYFLAGIWYNFGKLLHLSDGFLIYWVRFINLPIYLILILLARDFCRQIAPSDHKLEHGVLVLLAFFPQSIFYSINTDVLSPVAFLAAVVALLRLFRNDAGRLGYLITGGLIAAFLLIKLTSIASACVLAMLLCFLCYSLHKESRLQPSSHKIVLLLFSAVIPPLAWYGRNYYVFGDWTAMAIKMEHLSWTIKPVSQLYDHPIFTFTGFHYFLKELIKTFWRGELVWHLQPVALAISDFFYTYSTVIFVGFGVFWSLRRTEPELTNSRAMYALITATVLLNIALLAIASIRYDFGMCWYPSRDCPYFISGRLIISTLVPFLILYVRGIDFLCQRFDQRLRMESVIGLIALICLGSEIISAIRFGYFGSSFNLFSLLF